MPAPLLLDRFVEHAHRRPGAPALIWHGETITYGELHSLARQAHAELIGLDHPDRPVGVLAKKSPQAIALVIACLMARRRFLLPSVDLGEATLRALFEHAGCSHVLSTEPAGPRDRLTGAIHAVGTCGPAPAPECPDDVLFMLTTSGSTGLPKVVPLPTGAVDRFADWAAARFGIGAGETVLSYAPLNFDLCLLDIWTTLRSGGCVVLVDQDQATQASHLLEALTAGDVHLVQGVPLLYRLLIDATRERGQCFTAVQHVVVTGDSIPARYLTELPRLFPAACFYNLYGCTETNDSFMHEIRSSDMSTTAPMPIGEPLPGVHALVLTEDGCRVEGSGMGELWISTPFQSQGYLDPALNDGTFVARDDGDGQRTYFRTGDLVRRQDDGSTILAGRKDCYVKVRGVRVNTQEIERIILEHEEVLEAAVIAVPDETVGRRLHAIVRRRRATDLNSLTLRRHCASRLPRSVIPTTIEITESALPSTATGKVDRLGIRHARKGGDMHGLH